MNWQEALLKGNLSEAKTRFFESNEDVVLEGHFWSDLEALQRYLRAKHWQRAYNVIEDFSVDDSTADLVSSLIDKGKILVEIEVLKSSSILLDRRRPEEALEALQSVTQPLLFAEKMCQQGTANIFLNDIEKAKQEFAGGLELDPKHYRVLTNLGNLHLEAKETDTAIQYYENALAIKEDFPNALHNLGVAYRQKGQISKSVNYIKKAQSNQRKSEAEDAKGALSSSVANQGGKFIKYGFYALAVIVVLWLLRSRGIL